MTTNKIRVAVADRPEALGLVVAAVDAALPGARTTPELQEIDRSELVVQLDVGGLDREVAPGDVRHRVSDGTGLDVLSTWREDEPPPRGRRPRPATVVRGTSAGLPPAARRAVRTGVPTAQWDADGVGAPAPECRPGWLLAVPLDDPGGGKWVALAARPGRLRFDLLDVRVIAGACSPPGAAVTPGARLAPRGSGARP